jgi:hypothetical protein
MERLWKKQVYIYGRFTKVGEDLFGAPENEKEE